MNVALPNQEALKLAADNGLPRCDGCPFPHGKLVGSRGPKDSPLVIVGESPGKMEILKNTPFAGPSGDILKAALAQGDIEPYILNAHICFPGTVLNKNQDKVITAAHKCNPRLMEEINAYPRQVILTLGNAALWSCTGNYGYKITQVRGRVFPSTLSTRGIVSAVHPSFLLRGGGSLRQFMADVGYAIALTKGNDFRKYIVPKYQVVSSELELNQLAQQFKDLPIGTVVAADSETGGYDGFDYLRDHILCTGYCIDPNLVYIIPEDLVSRTGTLYDNGCRFLWHNGKFDIKFHRAAGVPARVDEDTMLLSYALDEIGGVHDLETVASDVIGAPDWKFMIKPSLDAAKSSHPKGYRVTYADIPKDILYDYTCRDISATLQCFPVLRQQVRSNPHLERLYTRTLIPLSEYLVEVEEAGLNVDLTQVNKNKTRLETEAAKYEAQINDIAHSRNCGDINPRSPTQLAPFLYDVLKLRPQGSTKRPDSTDVGTLEKLPQVPVIVALKKYRKVQKALSTYVEPVPGWINIDNRVHTTYKIHGTRTGRLASEDPNLLNIPRDPELRGQFTASSGDGEGLEGSDELFLEIDENQAELRVLAELSGDEALKKVYTIPGHPGIHDTVTLDLFGKISEYTPEHFRFMLEKFNLTHIPEKDWRSELYHEQKMKAKNVNFGIPYGITNIGLADQIEDTPQVAQQYLDAWYKKFPGAQRFLLKCREAVVLGNRIITPFGRIKRFGAVSREMVMELQNQASNFPMQSIASDIMIHVGFKMRPIVRKLNIPICNTVYDSILYRVPNDPILINDLAAQTIHCVRETAQYWAMKTIPMEASAKKGTRWGNLEEFKVQL